jgi:hypothetical protein
MVVKMDSSTVGERDVYGALWMASLTVVVEVVSLGSLTVVLTAGFVGI